MTSLSLSRVHRKDTIGVAMDLIGKWLVSYSSQRVRIGKIVETEAYLGHEDPGCHTYEGRRTPRTEPMYGPPGNAYVYLIYGMYHCLNFVTGNGEAVLIRALEPIKGFSDEVYQKKALSGPGRLCKQLQIDRRHNGISLLDAHSDLFIAEGPHPLKASVSSGPRVGIAYAGDAAYWPLRFGETKNPYLSQPKLDQ